MTHKTLFGVAVVVVAGCSTQAPESVQPRGCLDVERIELQAILERNAAVHSVGEVGLIRTRNSGPMSDAERRAHKMETRQLAEQANVRAAEHSGRASRYRMEARALEADLRAQGIRCDG